jgi:DNA (cytosine-5)-methyltransferase 1
MLVRRGLAVVLGDLASLGYNASWCVLGAADVGAPHERKRIWIVADSNGTQRKGGGVSGGVHIEHTDTGRTGWWQVEPDMDRVADGMAYRVDRLKATGNGQVPAVAALAWRELTGAK